MTILLENPVGHLVVLRLPSAISREDWREVRHTMANLITPIQDCVFCVDWRALREQQSDAVMDQIRGLLSDENTRLRRSAILIEPSPFMLQLSHTVIKAAHPQRKVVYTTDELRGWLEPDLDPGERAAMEAFLQEDSAR